MKALVTGANGFIGSHLTRMLAEKGVSVVALILKGTDYKNIETYLDDVVEGDVTAAGDAIKAAKGVDAVFHLAALVSDFVTKEAALRVNTGGTENILKAASERGAKRFVLMSSLAVHHFRGYRRGDETALRDGFLTPYAYSKIKCEDAVNRFHAANKIEGVIVRPGLFPFGAGDYTSFYHLAKAFRSGIYMHINSGRAVLCTAYVENLCEGLMLCGSHKAAAGETFVIADDWEISWKELTGMFCKALNAPEPRFSAPLFMVLPIAAALEELYSFFKAKKSPPLTAYRAMVPARDFYFSNNKAKEMLGYQPKVSLEEAIKRTADWFLSLPENVRAKSGEKG